MKPIFINLSYLLLSCLLVSCYKKEEILYRWGTFSSWEWKTIGDKNINPHYKGEVKRKYFLFGDYILEGSGTLNVPNGEKYVGEWKNGNFNGQGTYTFSNGGSFVGFWKDSAPWNISGYNEKGEFVNYVEGKKTK